MRVLWLSWKDSSHPQAGGAEVVKRELAKRLVADGHEVLILTARYEGSSEEDKVNGYQITRVGGRYSVYWKAYRYYKDNLKGWADLVIDEVNTIPFFAKFYAKEKNITFIHQLAREIWFYQMFFPVSIVGYLLEPLYLRLLNDRKVITVSESTKKDLMKYGFKAKNIFIISEGIEIETVKDLKTLKKYPTPTLLSLGAVRAMKRTLDQVKAFEIAKKDMPKLQLKIAGDTGDGYAKKVLDYINQSPYKKDIEVLGKVSKEKKIELMQKCHAILVTSVKEGWGLIVTEANSQGTPAVVYNVDGLRDSVKHKKTGLIAEANNPLGIAGMIVRLLGSNSDYDKLQNQAWQFSKQINFNSSYKDLKNVFKYL